MSKAALHLADLTIPEKVTLSRTVATSVAADPAYSAADVAPAKLTQGADALEAAAGATVAAHKNWLACAATQRTLEKAQDEMLTAEARCVERISGGDEAKIKAKGFEVAAKPVHTEAALPAPSRFALSDGDHAGQVDAQWAPVPGAHFYQVATAPKSDGPFTLAMGSTKSKATLEGLPSAAAVWVRVAPQGAAGLGAWSAPQQIVVP